MQELEYLRNIRRIIEDLLKNSAKAYGIDFAILNETMIETERRTRAVYDNDTKHHGMREIPIMIAGQEHEIEGIVGWASLMEKGEQFCMDGSMVPVLMENGKTKKVTNFLLTTFPDKKHHEDNHRSARRSQ